MKSSTIRVKRPADPFASEIQARPDLTFDEVSSLIAQDQETGQLFWRQRTTEMFGFGNPPSESYCRAWNTRYAEKEALAAINSNGYRTGFIWGKPYTAHRVMWLLCTGSWPEAQIDHINGNRKDNRMGNLRVVTAAENMKNKAMPHSNSSGVVGVTWDIDRQKWIVRIRSGGCDYNLGRFDDLSEAKRARQLGQKRFGFHENHGRPFDVSP